MVDKKKVIISGVAVREGTSLNKRKYLASELHTFAETLKGKVILKDHESFTDNVLGKVTESESVDGGKLVTYKGWIKEDGTGILEKLRDGRISEVSIGAIARKILRDKEDKEVIIPIGIRAIEISTTPTPGNPNTSINLSPEEKYEWSKEKIKEIIAYHETNEIQKSMDNSEELKNNKYEKDSKGNEYFYKKEPHEINNSQSFSLENNIQNKKEDIMEAEKTQSTNTVEEVNTEAIKKAEALEKELEVAKEALEVSKKEKAAVEESRRQDAIKRYTEKANAKELKVKDLSNATMEMILFAIEMADEAEEPVAEEPEKEEPVAEPEAEEPVVEEPKEEEKPEAQPESEEAEEEESEEEKFEGYVLERAEGGTGYAFYKDY